MLSFKESHSKLTTMNVLTLWRTYHGYTSLWEKVPGHAWISQSEFAETRRHRSIAAHSRHCEWAWPFAFLSRLHSCASRVAVVSSCWSEWPLRMTIWVRCLRKRPMTITTFISRSLGFARFVRVQNLCWLRAISSRWKVMRLPFESFVGESRHRLEGNSMGLIFDTRASTLLLFQSTRSHHHEVLGLCQRSKTLQICSSDEKPV